MNDGLAPAAHRAPRPHVGIVACSAEGAALCYRTLCVEGAGVFGIHAHPEVSLHTHCLADYMKHIRRGAWAGVAELMLSSARRLARIGAELLICPDNTIHQALPLVEPHSPRPWLHIARVVGEEAQRRGFRRLGVLGTKYLMEGPVYASALGQLDLQTLAPEPADRAHIDQVIFDELVNGIVSDAARAYFKRVIAKLGDRGCDAVVLGCTEIPLLVRPEDSPLPTLDSTRLLARAALHRAAAMSRSMVIRAAREPDLPAIAEIYNYEVEHSTATFDTQPVTVKERRRWLAAHEPTRHPVIVAEVNDAVAAWACLSSWSERCAYARAAEVSVYVHREHRGCGIGRALLLDLIARARAAGLGVLLARICTADGPASLRLHKSVGFQRVGTMRRVGEKLGRILDVELLEHHLQQ